MSEHKSIDEFMAEKETMGKKEKSFTSWPKFVENDVLTFFNAHGIEKMSIEDGEGGKAKLTRTKDGGVKIDLTSTSVY